MAGEQQQFFLKWNDFQSNMVSSFKHLRDEKSFTDVTLACDGQTCKAHKMVLSACSPYFKSLLEVIANFNTNQNYTKKRNKNKDSESEFQAENVQETFFHVGIKKYF